MYIKEKSQKLVELGKTSATALRLIILLEGYDLPVVFSNSSLAAVLGVSPSAVSIALKIIREEKIIKLFKVGTAHIYIPDNYTVVWEESETKDFFREVPTYTLVSKSEQEDIEGEFAENSDENKEEIPFDIDEPDNVEPDTVE